MLRRLLTSILATWMVAVLLGTGMLGAGFVMRVNF